MVRGALGARNFGVRPAVRALHPLHGTTLAPKTWQDADGRAVRSRAGDSPKTPCARPRIGAVGLAWELSDCAARVPGTVDGMRSNADNRSAARGSEAVARIAQAQGMVSVQADCTLDAALALLRNTARATDETVEDIAGEVVQRHVRFE